MAIRIIEYKVNATGITPLTEQQGGMQGDHNATELKFTLTAELLSAIKSTASGTVYYRFDGYSGAGTMYSTSASALFPESYKDGDETELTYSLENALTRDGGNIRVYLVITEISDEDGLTTERELYSFPALIRLKAVAGRSAYGTQYKSITGAELSAISAAEKAQKAKDEAEMKAGEAIEAMNKANDSAESADSSAASAKSSAEAAAKKLNEFKNSVDQEYAPTSTNPQSGTAVAEAVSGKMDKFGKVTTTEKNGIYSRVIDLDDIGIVDEIDMQGVATQGGIKMSMQRGIEAPNTSVKFNSVEVASDVVDTSSEYRLTTKKYVDEKIGSIETALDSIIAVQEMLIGGGE